MSEPTEQVGLDDVDGAIARGFPLLRFSPALERQFEVDTGNVRCQSMIRLNWIAMLLYHGFLITDYYAVPDAFQIDLIMHFVVMTPLILVMNYVLSKQPAVPMREGVEALGSVALALTIAVVVSYSRMPDRDMELFTVALVVSFTVVMQRIRFWYLVPCCLALQAVYTVGLASTMAFSMERALLCNSIFLMIVMFCLVGAYNMEREHRMGYLLALRERLRGMHLELASLRDPLTGIGNRRALDAELARQTLGSVTEPLRSTGVLLLDVDHFKDFNDTNGHQEGDACLRRVAGLVRDCLREGEGSVFRFGGEEFLVLLRDSTVAEASIVAERVRSTIADARIMREPGGALFVTVSIGVSAGRLANSATTDGLISEADQALYAAKRNGRDRVCGAVDPSGTPSARREWRMAG